MRYNHINMTTHSLQLSYIGHATVLIELDGIRLLTDPLLRNRVVHLRRREPVAGPLIEQNVDAVLISHLHFDHLDLPSLQVLGAATRLIVPRGAGDFLRRHNFDQVEEIGVDEMTTVGSLTIRATYALHLGRRHPLGLAADSLGFVIEGSQTVYFAGDTDLFPAMANLTERLDLALLPVWGWGPTLGKGHLTPQRAAQALTLLRPEVAVPIHWGTLHPLGLGWLNPSFLDDPPRQFVHHAAQLAPDVEVLVVPPGNQVALGHAASTFL
jgi:L-ascorbate metabolism protein UlaG (beta-lactamase superfamily)